MNWITLLRTFLPLIIKLLQGIAQLPPEQQQQVFEAMIAPGPEDTMFEPHNPTEQHTAHGQQRGETPVDLQG